MTTLVRGKEYIGENKKLRRIEVTLDSRTSESYPDWLKIRIGPDVEATVIDGSLASSVIIISGENIRQRKSTTRGVNERVNGGGRIWAKHI